MEEIKNLLGEEIKSEIRSLSTLDAGSKEKSTAIDDLAKLYRLRIEETKNEQDLQEKCERRTDEFGDRMREEELKRDELAEQVKERYFRLGLEVAGIVLPMMFYAVWMKRGFKFEETGTYTSTTFRGLFNRFRPTRK